MKRYLVDTTNCKQIHESIRLILPFKDGEHDKDLDLIECEVPKDVYQKMQEYLKSKKGSEFYNLDLPIGANFPLPDGAVITVIGDY